MKRVILIGGGTGGHCLPIQVTFQSFKKRKIDCYIVTDKRGKNFFSKINSEKIITIWQPIGSNTRVSQLINFPLVFLQSFFIFFRLKPNFTIGFGGYITFPFLLSGSILKYKIAAHEANAVLGKANKLLMYRIKYLFTAFIKTKKIHKKFLNKTIHVGMPIRVYKSLKPKKNHNNSFRICIIGGSQGAKSFSDFIPHAILKLQNENKFRFLVDHQVRKNELNLVKNIYNSSGIENNVKDFFSDMPKRIFESDLIISRSGSSTVNEIIYYGKPAILIPYPYAVDNHQYYNALELEKLSIGKIILHQNLSVKKLYFEIMKIFKNKVKRRYINVPVPKVGKITPSEKMYDLIKGEL
tara:strand:- start:50 stop:1108 length:1059 start_codon:yes stop_codon:yes gene_type:complete